MSGAVSYHLTLTADMEEPGLVPSAFDLLRTQARACGLKEVGGIKVHLELQVSGRVRSQQVEELRARLEALWFGEVEGCEIRRPAEEQA